MNKSTVSQIKSDIDAGRTGDKVDFPDPAAAPLGTDEEAAGTLTDPAALIRPQDSEAPAENTDKAGTRHGPSGRRAAYLACVAIVVLAGGLGMLALYK